MLKDFKAILFDFDGVLADSMEDNFLAWKKAFQEFGIEIKKQDYFPLEGMKLIEIAKIISNKYNIDPNLEEIVGLKNKYYLETRSFRFYKGIPELINSLKRGNKLIAIVSASPKEKLEKTVPEDFLNKFDAIVSAEDVNKGKPNPEPYVKAMKKLNIFPENCIVIENAPLGIESAKSAGVYCIALTTTLNKKYLKKADRILNNHKELKRLFR